METPRFLGLIILGAAIGFPVAFALYWIFVSLQPGIFPYLWPMWIGAGLTLLASYRMVERTIHGKEI